LYHGDELFCYLIGLYNQFGKPISHLKAEIHRKVFKNMNFSNLSNKACAE